MSLSDDAQQRSNQTHLFDSTFVFTKRFIFAIHQIRMSPILKIEKKRNLDLIFNCSHGSFFGLINNFIIKNVRFANQNTAHEISFVSFFVSLHVRFHHKILSRTMLLMLFVVGRKVYRKKKNFHSLRFIYHNNSDAARASRTNTLNGGKRERK